MSTVILDDLCERLQLTEVVRLRVLLFGLADLVSPADHLYRASATEDTHGKHLRRVTMSRCRYSEAVEKGINALRAREYFVPHYRTRLKALEKRCMWWPISSNTVGRPPAFGIPRIGRRPTPDLPPWSRIVLDDYLTTIPRSYGTAYRRQIRSTPWSRRSFATMIMPRPRLGTAPTVPSEAVSGTWGTKAYSPTPLGAY